MSPAGFHRGALYIIWGAFILGVIALILLLTWGITKLT